LFYFGTKYDWNSEGKEVLTFSVQWTTKLEPPSMRGEESLRKQQPDCRPALLIWRLKRSPRSSTSAEEVARQPLLQYQGPAQPRGATQRVSGLLAHPPHSCALAHAASTTSNSILKGRLKNAKGQRTRRRKEKKKKKKKKKNENKTKQNNTEEKELKSDSTS
jgi:hypothetical protein